MKPAHPYSLAAALLAGLATADKQTFPLAIWHLSPGLPQDHGDGVGAVAVAFPPPIPVILPGPGGQGGGLGNKPFDAVPGSVNGPPPPGLPPPGPPPPGPPPPGPAEISLPGGGHGAHGHGGLDPSGGRGHGDKGMDGEFRGPLGVPLAPERPGANNGHRKPTNGDKPADGRLPVPPPGPDTNNRAGPLAGNETRAGNEPGSARATGRRGSGMRPQGTAPLGAGSPLATGAGRHNGTRTGLVPSRTPAPKPPAQMPPLPSAPPTEPALFTSAGGKAGSVVGVACAALGGILGVAVTFW